MSGVTAVVPFEKQGDAYTNRDCGAACLSMVYRSLGKEVAQSEIWPAIAKENRFGRVSSTTHLMAKDALSRGLSAVAFQARNPLQVLRLCCDSGTRAILNHRCAHDSPTGHYTVLVDLDERDIVLHDPFYGPCRRVPRAELLELWQPRFSNSEITGSLLLGISTKASAATSCWLCRTPIPLAVSCPQCNEPVSLHPSAVLGCVSSHCLARMWNYICCPSCDVGFTLASQDLGGGRQPVPAADPEPSAAPQPASAREKEPLDLSRMFAEVDKFCSFILTIPAAAAHPEIKKQLDFIASSKEKLKAAMADSSAHRKAHQEQLAKMAQTAKQGAEAHRKKMEELNRPSPPLDAAALAIALLKNLGMDRPHS